MNHKKNNVTESCSVRYEEKNYFTITREILCDLLSHIIPRIISRDYTHNKVITVYHINQHCQAIFSVFSLNGPNIHEMIIV